MAIEKRGKRWYRYRSYRTEDGRVAKQYLGRASGPAPAIREQRWPRDLEAERALANAADELCQLESACDVLLAAHLIVNGYYRSNYGPWRKRRVATT